MRLAVAGGSGLVGSYVAAAARAAGHELRVVSRSEGVDLRTGDGLAAALDGVDAIIDTTNPDTMEEAAATDFFTTATANLHSSGAAAGIGHLVTLSIVGLENAPTGYYAAKLAHERAALTGALPATILRATQFHEFAGQIVSWNRDGDSARIPNHRVQTVAARTVAEQLIAVTERGAGVGDRAADLGGPEQTDLVELATRFVARFGWGVQVTGFDPGVPEGSRLPGRGALLSGPTFAEWLAGPDAARIGRPG